jgi:hypothetical protein
MCKKSHDRDQKHVSDATGMLSAQKVHGRNNPIMLLAYHKQQMTKSMDWRN